MMLFQEDVGETDSAEVKELFWRCHTASREARELAEQLFDLAIDNAGQIDRLIRESAHNWKLERISAVDRNILRLAIAEFLFFMTPKAVIMDEAIEIARKFGSEKSPGFVNGILDAVTERAERSPV